MEIINNYIKRVGLKMRADEIQAGELLEIADPFKNFVQPNRAVGIIEPENAKRYFLGAERSTKLDRILNTYDDLMAGSSRELVKLRVGRVIELSSYEMNNGDRVRSLILPRIKTHDDTHKARAFSIIETQEFGIYGEFHSYESRSGKNSEAQAPERLKGRPIEIFEVLEGAHIITTALSLPTRDLLSA